MNQRGSFTVEAALVIPVVLLVALAGLEALNAVITHQEMVAAAREGARVAATVPDPARAVAAVRNALGADLGNAVRVTVRRPAAVGRPAEVIVRYSKPLVTPLLGGFSIELRARAVMRVEL